MPPGWGHTAQGEAEEHNCPAQHCRVRVQQETLCPCSCHIVLKTSLCALISVSIFWKKFTMVHIQTWGKKRPGVSHFYYIFFFKSKSVSSACSASSNLFSTLSQKAFLHRATLWNLSPAFAWLKKLNKLQRRNGVPKSTLNSNPLKNIWPYCRANGYNAVRVILSLLKYGAIVQGYPGVIQLRGNLHFTYLTEACWAL